VGLLDTEAFDAVFTDFHMPGMMGDELVAAIKTRFPALPVVLVTSYYDSEPFQKADKGQVAYLVRKPFARKDLLDALAEIL
jgi:CheY-like chemotaxis protein